MLHGRILVVLAALLIAALAATPSEALSKRIVFPHFRQCDPRWGNDMMGVKGPGERNTICNEGCAMTSTAMALAGLMTKINGSLVNPGTFNTWLKENNGYLCLAGDCNNLRLTAPEELSAKLNLIGETVKPSFEEIEQDIALGNVVHVAHVRNNSHFVLLIGTSRDTTRSFYVNDPYYKVRSYPYANVSDIIRFKVNKYPVYKQCDPRWGSNVMGANNQTICDVGCLMSSISSALAGTDIHIENVTSTPATLNEFLRTHHGYDPNSALFESVIPKINPARIVWPPDGMHTTNDLNFTTIKEYLDRPVPRIVIANVMQGQHFVLVVGYRSDGDTLVVNDSGFNRNTYSRSKDVVGWRIFDMK